MKKRPNILFFVPDSYRGDVLAHQGYPAAHTPNLDALVERGAISYANAFAQNPVCTPSRCSFMTGWYPHTHGHRSMRNMLKEHEPNLLSVMRREGYKVWWCGKNDLMRVECAEDYLKYCDIKLNPGEKYDDRMEHRAPPPLDPDDPRRGAYYGGVMRRDGEGKPRRDGDTARTFGAVDLIREHDGEQPFFCFMPLGLPHPAYCVEDDFYNLIDPEKLPPRIQPPGPDDNPPPFLKDYWREYRSGRITNEMWLDVKRIYYAMCAKVDALFGMVVDALIEKGICDETWIFFLSDHGDFAGDYSLPEKTHVSLQDSLLRVPLLIKPASDVPVQPGNRRHLTELVDITATIYDMLGIEPGYDHQGASLRSSLAGDETPIHDAVFAEVGSRKGEAGFFNTDVDKMPPDSFYATQSRAARPWAVKGSYAVSCRTMRHKYVRRPYTGFHELYDLESDPGERRNLAGNPKLAEVERRMESRMLDYFLLTGDVLPHEKDSRSI